MRCKATWIHVRYTALPRWSAKKYVYFVRAIMKLVTGLSAAKMK